jgi:hypothetical protein
VVGSIPALGGWKDYKKAKLTWSEGHVWQLKDPIVSNTSVFQYKFVVI